MQTLPYRERARSIRTPEEMVDPDAPIRIRAIADMKDEAGRTWARFGHMMAAVGGVCFALSFTPDPRPWADPALRFCAIAALIVAVLSYIVASADANAGRYFDEVDATRGPEEPRCRP